jgi:hypothetical protein
LLGKGRLSHAIPRICFSRAVYVTECAVGCTEATAFDFGHLCVRYAIYTRLDLDNSKYIASKEAYNVGRSHE